MFLGFRVLGYSKFVKGHRVHTYGIRNSKISGQSFPPLIYPKVPKVSASLVSFSSKFAPFRFEFAPMGCEFAPLRCEVAP